MVELDSGTMGSHFLKLWEVQFRGQARRHQMLIRVGQTCACLKYLKQLHMSTA